VISFVCWRLIACSRLLKIASTVQAKADGRYTAIFNSYSETFETKRTKQQILVFCWQFIA